jgi:predicted nucleic acid-binding protein
VLVLDASCLVELVTDGQGAEAVRQAIPSSETMAAPHLVDVEVFGVIRRDHLRGALDRTASRLALERLTSWPGERFPHTRLLDRAWELRDTVRGWDAMYVALAEALGATLLTLDERLASAPGPRCRIVNPARLS